MFLYFIDCHAPDLVDRNYCNVHYTTMVFGPNDISIWFISILSTQPLVIFTIIVLIGIYIIQLCKGTLISSNVHCLDLILFMILAGSSCAFAVIATIIVSGRIYDIDNQSLPSVWVSMVVSYISTIVYLGLFVIILVTFCRSKSRSRREASSSVAHQVHNDPETAPLLGGGGGNQAAVGYSYQSTIPGLTAETALSGDEDQAHAAPQHRATPSQQPRGATGLIRSELEQRIGTIVNKALGEFIRMIKEGIPALNIPSLDPIEIPGNQDFDFSAMLFNIQGSFGDFKIAGLSLMNVPDLSFEDQKVTATTTTKIEISGNYSLSGRVSGFFSVNSNSTLKCTIGVLKATIDISYKDPRKLEAVVELESTNVEVKLNDAAAAKPILSKLGGPIASFIENSLGPTLQTALQKILDQHVNDTGSTD